MVKVKKTPVLFTNPMSIKAKPITVIGAGAWGTALALLLARNGNPVRLWGHNPTQLLDMEKTKENRRYLPSFGFPENLHVIQDLSQSLEGVEDILVVVPSHAFRDMLQEIAKYSQNPRIAWGTKGLDPATHNLLHLVAQEIFSTATPMAVLSGPSFAKEVAEQKPTAVSLAGTDQRFIDDMIERLRDENFRVYQNFDLLGVELCGTLKNILAIAVGVVDGLGLGANARAAVITRGLAELGRLCEAMGADRQTLLSLSGIGDIVLTCTDDQSRNRRFGKAIGAGKSIPDAQKEINQSIEGLHNVKQVVCLAGDFEIDMPITKQVYRILFEKVKPEQAVRELLARATAASE